MGQPKPPPLSEALIREVSEAFKSYHSTLALSRSPLADSPLVEPALVRDAVSPTADERGQALRLVLRWAVGRMAPEPAAYPLDSDRPYDDPAWRDPRWWRYNILRHRYLEPLHPDEFIAGGRYTETLIALTGIPSADSFFDERNRAVREVAAWLHQQLATGAATEVLTQMALQETLAPLRGRPAARALLAVAATCAGVFPRALLLHLAAAEPIAGAAAALADLEAERLLRADSAGRDLWLAPPLQAHLYAHDPADARQRRHLQAARFFAEAGSPLAAADHWQRAERWARAAGALLAAAAELVDELHSEALCAALGRFPPGALPADQERATQLLRSDLALRHGQRAEALEACRRALRQSATPAAQAPLYRRLGKLYEQQNQRHALSYYEQAAQRFSPADPELVTLHTDRAWLYILRREWGPAAADLKAALAAAPEEQRAQRANIYDALASLHRQQGDMAQAVAHAQAALALRELVGNPARLADSCNNLGLLYSAGGDQEHALAAFGEALARYRQLGGHELVAATLLNSGMAHHLAGRQAAALPLYRECLEIASGGGNRLLAVRAGYNLAEALAELGDLPTAADHWRAAAALSRAAAFDDELRDLDALRARFPALGDLVAAPPVPADLDTAARQALMIAAQAGQITPRALMAAAGLSKATATRRLSELAQRGLLRQVGRGRSTCYAPAQLAPAPPPLAEQIAPHASTLAAAGLAALGLIAGDERRLIARLAAPLDLAAFFALARQLAAALGRPVDLLPEDHAAALKISAAAWVVLAEPM